MFQSSVFFSLFCLIWAAPHLGCCLPLTCQFAVKLLQEAGLSGEKSKADWVGTRLMVDLWLCGGGRKKRDELGSEKLHERGLLGLPMQSLHASLEDWGLGGRVGRNARGANASYHRCVSPSVCTLAAVATVETETKRFQQSRVATLTRRPSRVAFMHGLHAFSPSCTATLPKHRHTGTHSRHFTDTAVVSLCCFVFGVVFVFFTATTDRGGITGAGVISLYLKRPFNFSF